VIYLPLQAEGNGNQNSSKNEQAKDNAGKENASNGNSNGNSTQSNIPNDVGNENNPNENLNNKKISNGKPTWINEGNWSTNNANIDEKGKKINVDKSNDCHRKFHGTPTSKGYEFTYTYENNSAIHNINITLSRLIEFEDVNNNGIADAGEIVSDRKINYNDINITELTVNNTQMFKLTDNILTVIFYIPSNHTVINNRNLSLDEIKFDIIIDNYSYALENTSLAVEMNIDFHSNKIIHGLNKKSNEEGMAASLSNGNLYFSWLSDALVDGNTSKVFSNINLVNKTVNIEFSFKHGESIYYDPYLGISNKIFSDIIYDTIIFEHIRGDYLLLIPSFLISAVALLTIRLKTKKLRHQ